MKDKVIAVVYHSSSASNGDFIHFLKDILIIKGQCVLIGDFNIDLMKDSFYAKKLTTEMSFLGVKQYIDKPTQVTKDSETLIDLIFANSKINCKVYDKLKITDHSWINVEILTSNEDREQI